MKRLNKRRRQSLTSKGIIRKFINAARREAKERASVLGFGIGIKQSRRKGLSGLPSITFVVQRKRPHPKSEEELPKLLQITHQGKTYRVRTDVLSQPRAVEQITACTPRNGATGGIDTAYYGTPGFLAQTSDKRCYLVTAGHVLLRPSRSSLINGDGLVVPNASNGSWIGNVTLSQSYFAGSTGFVDVAIIPIKNSEKGTLFAHLNMPPWNSVGGYLTDNDLNRLWAMRQGYVEVWGATTHVSAELRFVVATQKRYDFGDSPPRSMKSAVISCQQ